MILHHHFTLPNSLRIAYLPSDSPTSYCGLAIRAGTRDEAETHSGLAHFVEHMLFKGTERRKSHHILRRMEAVGGELNAYTTKEETFLYAICLEEDAPRAIELIADLAFHSQFPASEIGKEMEVVLDEIRSYEDNPAEAIFDEFENILFKDSEMGRPILGSAASLQTFSSAACRTFVDAHYYPENMVFFFKGKTAWSKIVRMAGQFLGEWTGAAGRKAVDRQRIPPQPQPAIQTHQNKDLHQCHVVLGGRAYGLHEEKRTGLFLINNLLGGPGMNSRLNISLRERRGLVYTVDSSTVSYSDAGMFTIYFGCDPESAPQCRHLIDKELQKLRDTALTSSQLRAAVKQLKGQMGIAADQHENVAQSLGKSFLYYNRYPELPEMFRKLDALTPKALLEITNEIFDPRQLFELTYE